MKSARFWVVVLLLVFTVVIGGTTLAARPAGTDASSSGTAGGKIEPLVLTEVAEAGSTDFFVWMTEKADLSPAAEMATKEAKGRFVFASLTATAERTQKDLRAYLDSQGAAYKPFYIANKILVQGGSQELVLDVAARADVARITANHDIQLQEPFINPNPPESTAAIEPNITWVGADDVWAMGYRGDDITLAGNDTGMDWDHPALKVQYRGWDGSSANHNYNWWDATGTYPNAPGDGYGHGTHVSGTMAGDDGAANQIGMAPAARLVHCKNLDDGGFGSDATIIECFEWDLAPWDLSGNNPDPDMAPDAINNSWGWFGGGQSQYQDEIAALQAAGVAVEVSAGNEGPGCSSLRSPGDYLDVATTGSVNHASVYPGTITSFSSRGPSDLAPNNETFPDFMAPGENVRSSWTGGGYLFLSGTSMSGPHVVGLIGLMWNASPAIRGNVAQTFQIIKDTAVPLTGQQGSNCGGDYTVGPNHDWGWGTIDAVAAVNEAIEQGGPNFTLEATPEEISICAPSNAVYTADLGQILGYSFSVNLSVTGVPAGATASFSPSAVVPPGSSNLTIGNTAAAAWGDYTLTITGIGTDPEVKTHSDTVDLSLRTAAPSGVTLSSPANGAINVPRVPVYQWNAASQAETYELEVATDPAFTNVVYTATVAETSHTSTISLESLATYYWRVRAGNMCGTGSYSATWSFTTEGSCNVLLLSGGHTDNTQATADAFAANMTGLNFTPYFVGTPPTLDYLNGFDAVLLYENGVYLASNLTGDVVYDYITERNGNVVYGTFYWQDRDGDYDGTGWGDLETIDPFLGPGAEYSFHSLAGTLPHALTGGVNELTIDAYGAGTFANTGATTVALWNDGDHFIGHKTESAGQRQVAVSMFPEYNSYGGYTGDFYRTWENALKWAAAGAGRCDVNTLRSGRIQMAYEQFNPDELVARLRVVDQNLAPVAGARVLVTFNLPDGTVQASDVTNAQGLAMFRVTTAGGGTCSLRTEDVKAMGLNLWDPAASQLGASISCP